MTVPSFASMAAREWRVLLRDPWLLSLVSWVPLLLCVVFLPAGVALAGLGSVTILNLLHSRPLGFAPSVGAAAATAA